MKIVLCLCALLAFAGAFHLSDEIPTLFVSHDLPNNLLAEISARLATDGPLDDIWKLFDTLETNIRNEQVKHDELYTKQQAECKSERSFRNKEIADATSALNRAGEEKNSCQISLTQAQGDLKTNLKSQTDIENALQTIQQQRTGGNEAYQQRVREHTESLQAIEQGASVLHDLYSGTANLVDLSKVSMTMLKYAIVNHHTQYYSGLAGALAQVAQKADMLIDPAILARVQELFAKLKAKVEGSLQTEEESEKKAVEEFMAIKSNLENQLQKLKENEQKLRIDISNYEQCVLQANNIIQDATTKKERNSGLLENGNRMCNTFDSEYQTANSQRKEQLELLAKLRAISQAKLGSITKPPATANIQIHEERPYELKDADEEEERKPRSTFRKKPRRKLF